MKGRACFDSPASSMSSHLLIIHRLEKIRCTHRRVPSSFSREEEIRPLCGAKAGPAKHLGLSGAGDEPTPVWGTVWWYPLWTVLDNQHP
ncbi:hypothetical protein [Aneurinibacillus migulanus]|jgi:hypothetical protein|uniref:hypothetical protein n=1 Tax=Aneurinibacillus migulanus TaxID=47500 RepID=UPI000AB912B4|nr:hypothetical protein [Aneurinibacillus migulanus]